MAHAHLDLSLVAKRWHLFFRIHLSIEIESFYFNFLLSELIDYEHARYSSSAVDKKHLNDRAERGVLGKFAESEATRIIAIM